MDYSALDARPDPRRTDLAEFNELMDAVEDVFAGRALVDRALEALDRADRALGGMQHGFLEGLPLREHTSLVQDVASDLDERFTFLRDALPRLAAALETFQEEAARSEMERVHEAVHGVCSSFRRLREEDESRGPASECPFVEELVRVGRGFLKGRLPFESLRLAVARFEEYSRRLSTGLEMLEPSARERHVFEDSRQAVQAALERQDEALQELRTFLEDWNEERVEPALEKILQSTRELVDVQQRLVEASEREERLSCPRCGTPNAVSDRFCAGCNAILPRAAPLPGMEEPQVDLMESGAPAGPAGQFEHLLQLEEAVASVQRGYMDPGEFAGLLEALDNRVREAERRLARMEPPPPETPPDQMEIYHAARQSLAEGAAGMHEGLALMRRWLSQGNSSHLNLGLETCLRAGEEVAAVQRLWEELMARAG